VKEDSLIFTAKIVPVVRVPYEFLHATRRITEKETLKAGSITR
jgi:hypothetical protein